MMTLHNLPKTVSRGKKRLGRGHGSGKVKTGGRGTKGQRSRGKISSSLGIAGVSFVRRLPLFRGKYRNKSFSGKTLVVNLKYLADLPKNTVVDRACLLKNHIVSSLDDKIKIKILGDGQISVPLTVKLPTSKSAARKIEKAGGSVESK